MNNSLSVGLVQRVVLDTNILISAALKADSAPRLAFRWTTQHGILLKSSDTEEELYRTLRKPKLSSLFVASDFLDRLDRVMKEAELVEIVEKIRACRDPDDDKFLELAVNGRADVIVSGDTDLRLLWEF